MITLTLGFFTGISFIYHYSPHHYPFLNILIFVLRNQFTLFFWITVQVILKDNFKFPKIYWIIIIFKLLLPVILFPEMINTDIRIIVKQASFLRVGTLIISNLIFILLIVREVYKGFSSKTIRKNKSKHLNLITFSLVSLIFISIILSMNLYYQYKMDIYIRYLNLTVLNIGMMVVLISVLTVEKDLVTEKKHFEKLKNLDYNDRENKLLNLVRVEKIYRNSKLTPESVAKLLEMNPITLRYIIKEKWNYENFNEFINEFRFQEALNFLETNKGTKVNLERLATDVGFNTYLTFWRYFKKKTKISPTDYIA